MREIIVLGTREQVEDVRQSLVRQVTDARRDARSSMRPSSPRPIHSSPPATKAAASCSKPARSSTSCCSPSTPTVAPLPPHRSTTTTTSSARASTSACRTVHPRTAAASRSASSDGCSRCSPNTASTNAPGRTPSATGSTIRAPRARSRCVTPLHNRTRTSESIPRKLLREGKLHLLPIYALMRTSDLAREGIENSGSYRFADHVYRNEAERALRHRSRARCPAAANARRAVDAQPILTTRSDEIVAAARALESRSATRPGRCHRRLSRALGSLRHRARPRARRQAHRNGTPRGLRA